MKQSQTPKNKKVNMSSPAPIPKEVFRPEVMADSFEVMEIYCQERIESLEKSMEQLNLLDNTMQIIFICQEIKVQRKILSQVIRKKVLSQSRNC